MMDRRYQGLLAVAAVLAAIRFLLVPWLDSQAEHHDRVQVLTQRLDRAQGVIENRVQIESAVTEVEAATGPLRQRYPSFEQAEAFRLATQQQVGNLAKEFSLTVRSFEWILDGEASGTSLSYSRARVQVEGAIQSIATWQATAEGRLPHMSAREFGLTSRDLVRDPETGSGTLTVVADFYWRPRVSGMSRSGESTSVPGVAP